VVAVRLLRASLTACVLLAGCELANPLSYLQAGGADASNPVDGSSHMCVVDPSVLQATAIASYDGTVCAIRSSDSSVVCWGFDDFGETGQPPDMLQSTPLPTKVPIGGPATAIAVGRRHAVAVDRNGNVWCWGAHMSAQCGLEPLSDSSSQYDSLPHPTPVEVPFSAGAFFSAGALVAAGDGFTCATSRDDTSVYCWGDDGVGETGAPPSGIQPTLTKVANTSGATLLATGAQHACASPSLGCWGLDKDEELGRTLTMSSCQGVRCSSTPVSPDNPNGLIQFPVKSVATGFTHTCVVDAAGNTYCWGAYDSGQTGVLPDSGTPNEPHLVADLPRGGAVAVYAGGSTTCVLEQDGSVWCFGENDSGQLGRGFVDPLHPDSAKVSMPPATAIAVGRTQVCAILRSCDVVCWGANDHGQLGTGNIGNQAIPSPQRVSPAQ
jgi:alpha-tubulin suppressor-like RCC1 family protein